VIANEAARSLTKLKAQHRKIFSSIPLLYRALHILSTRRYRLPVRRYVLDLFDVEFDAEVIANLHHLSHTMHTPEAINQTKKRSASTPASEAEGLGVVGVEIDMELESLEGSDEEFPTVPQPKVALKPLMKIDGFDTD